MSQGKFTDDDLARFKEDPTVELVLLGEHKIKAFLARLEAAEAVCSYLLGPGSQPPELVFMVEAWHKAAGK